MMSTSLVAFHRMRASIQGFRRVSAVSVGMVLGRKLQDLLTVQENAPHKEVTT